MTLRRNLRPFAALAAASAALGFTTAALAAPDQPGGKAVPAQGAPRPEPVPASDFRPVSSDIRILDDAGQVVDTRSCAWTVPQDDDRPCLSFASDPQVAFAAIERAGGVAATVHVVSVPIGLDSTSRYSRRADGTWLVRTRGKSNGEAFHNGRVCTADGQRCVRYDASHAKASVKSAKAAAAKLRRARGR